MKMKRVFTSFAQTRDRKQLPVPRFWVGQKFAIFVSFTPLLVQRMPNAVQPVLFCRVQQTGPKEHKKNAVYLPWSRFHEVWTIGPATKFGFVTNIVIGTGYSE